MCRFYNVTSSTIHQHYKIFSNSFNVFCDLKGDQAFASRLAISFIKRLHCLLATRQSFLFGKHMFPVTKKGTLHGVDQRHEDYIFGVKHCDAFHWNEFVEKTTQIATALHTHRLQSDQMDKLECMFVSLWYKWLSNKSYSCFQCSFLWWRTLLTPSR